MSSALLCGLNVGDVHLRQRAVCADTKNKKTGSDQHPVAMVYL